MTPEKIARIKAAYESTEFPILSVKLLALKFKIGQGTVSALAKENNFIRAEKYEIQKFHNTKHSPGYRHWREFSDEEHEAIRAYKFDKGKSVARTDRKFKISRDQQEKLIASKGWYEAEPSLFQFTDVMEGVVFTEMKMKGEFNPCQKFSTYIQQ